MSDFWEEYGKAYAVFAHYCSFDDWKVNLKQIAMEAAGTNQDAPLTVLDVGSGYGKDVLDLSRILLAQTQKIPVFDVVEPPSFAREMLRRILISHTEGGCLRNEYDDISEIGEEQYDAILFMNAAYYIEGFENVLDNCLERHLKPGGRVIILALPETSDFFLDIPDLVLPYNATEIQDVLCKRDIPFSKIQLRSTYYLPEMAALSQSLIDHLYTFMTESKISKEKFLTALVRKRSEGFLDFKDELIVIERTVTG